MKTSNDQCMFQTSRFWQVKNNNVEYKLYNLYSRWYIFKRAIFTLHIGKSVYLDSLARSSGLESLAPWERATLWSVTIWKPFLRFQNSVFLQNSQFFQFRLLINLTRIKLKNLQNFLLWLPEELLQLFLTGDLMFLSISTFQNDLDPSFGTYLVSNRAPRTGNRLRKCQKP